MSQRLHGCMNNGSHVDSLHNDPFAGRLRRGRIEPPQRSGFLNKYDRPTATRNNPTIVMPTMQQQQQQQQNTVAPKNKLARNANLKSDPTASSVIHKEVFSDNDALVEVTVKTHNAKHRSRSNSRASNREPWEKLLKRKPSHENPSSFHYFDPLRTLHFLAKELQNKLVESLPNDMNLLQMVQDMQQALQRIPPEVTSTAQLAGETCSKKTSNSDLRPTRLRTRSKENLHAEKLVHVVKPVTCDKASQTVRSNYAEAEKLQKHLEESSAKIENACKQMETVCTRLKSEKEELEIMLTAERETVKFLRKQMEDFENEKAENASAMIETLQAERESLQSQVKRLKSQIEMQQQGPTSQELRSLIQELRGQKSDADEQVQLLSHQVTLLNMEKEKYVAILSARDRQIKEIRCEMNQLQEVVNEQLAELQNGQCSSVPSSITNMTNEQPSWLLIKPKDDGKSKQHEAVETVPIKGDDTTLRQLFMKDKLSSSREMQGDSSGTSSEIHKKRGKKERSYKRKPSPYKQNEHLIPNLSSAAFMAHSDTHANIRNMFAEIKKQAMLVAAPVMGAQKVNGADMYHHSEQSVPK